MAGRPARLQVDIVTDADTRGIDRADSRLGKFGSSAVKVGKMAAAGLAVGLGLAAAAAIKLGQAAAEDEAGQARLAKTLENTTGATRKQVGAVEDWITAQGKQLGVADDELRPALAKLAAATNDVGQAQKLTSLAMDISAGSGKSLESVATALAKAQDGNVAGLSRLGVATKDAAGNTKTFTQLTKDLADVHGGQAATAAETTAGKYGRLKLQLSEMGEGIGSKLLPVAGRLATWALEMAPRAQKLAAQVGEKLAPTFARIGEFISTKAVPALRAFGEWIGDRIGPLVANVIVPTLNRAKDAFGNIRAAVERNEEPLGKLGRAIKKVAEFLIDDALPVVVKVIQLGWDPMTKAIGFTIDAIGKLVTWIDTAIGKLQDMWSWVQKIDVPDFNLPGWAGGAVGNLTTVAPTLTGGPSYGAPAHLARAAMGSGTWSAFTAATRSGALSTSGPTMIDARVLVTVDGSGIVDEQRVAQVLQPLLDRHAQRMGVRPLAAAGGF